MAWFEVDRADVLGAKQRTLEAAGAAFLSAGQKGVRNMTTTVLVGSNEAGNSVYVSIVTSARRYVMEELRIGMQSNDLSVTEFHG